MNTEQIYAEIQQLPMMAAVIRQKTPAAIKFLQELYFKVTGNTVYAGCKGCHIKAANYLSSLTYQTLKTMSEKKFTLKKGVSIEYPFRSGQRLTAGNITDQKAAEYLINNPTGIQHFSDFPQDDKGNLLLEQWFPSEKAEEPKKESAPAKVEAPKEEAPAAPKEELKVEPAKEEPKAE